MKPRIAAPQPPSIPTRLQLAAVLATVAILTLAPPAPAQSFNTGSSGALGALVVANNATNIITLPGDGILDFTDVRIGTNAHVHFVPNNHNTPVYLLATGDIVIAGTLHLEGAPASAANGGAGGPGGFDGGSPGFGGLAPGAGLGPGGGGEGRIGAYNTTNSAGAGAYASRPDPAYGRHGSRYGSSLLLPLVGGSGGGGGMIRGSSPGGGGGGGGGALLLASPTRIALVGAASILARGEAGHTTGAAGSGGAIRLVAPRVSVARSSGTFRLDTSSLYGGGDGRIRIDSLLDRGEILTAGITTGSGTVTNFVLGSFLFTGLTNTPPRFLLPRLDITRAAGLAIPEGSASPVLVQLPFNGNPNQSVTVQASGFPTSVFTTSIPIQVAVIPESGPAQTYAATLDHRPGNGRGTVNVPVFIPLNTACHIQAWTTQ
jgi:hypothetical protein